MAKKKILVIGSKGHKFADCVDWRGEIPYLGDYLYVILNLVSLTASTLRVLSLGKPFILDKLRDCINEIIWARTKIICITNNVIDIYSDKRGRHVSNYDWCPILLSFKNEKGEEFIGERKGYLSYVDRWTHFLDFDLGTATSIYKKQRRKEVLVIENSILMNLADKILAFQLVVAEFNKDAYGNIENLVKPHSIDFYPPTTIISVHDGIDYLVRVFLGLEEKEVKLPPWTDRIQLRKETELRIRIDSSNKLIAEATQALRDDEKELDSIIRFKGLLTEDGKILEDLIDKALVLLGVRAEKTSEGKKEDMIFHFQEDVIPIEITGRKGSIPERATLTQLIGRLIYEPPKIFKAFGILIGNHYKETPLNEKLEGRNRPFEPDVVRKAKEFNCCLISTLEIFKFIDRKLSGEDVDKEFQNRLLNTIGLG